MPLRGHFRDDFPRIRLPLPTRNGDTLTIEFLIDTGFNGDFQLPQQIASMLALGAPSSRRIRLADGRERDVPYYTLLVEWDDPETEQAERLCEVLVGGKGNPLIGTEILRGHFLQIELTDGGDVSVEPL